MLAASSGRGDEVANSFALRYICKLHVGGGLLYSEGHRSGRSSLTLPLGSNEK